MEREFIVPPELEGGSYAHTLAVWSSAHEFTLDFDVQVDQSEDGPYVVTARVRVPVTMMFELIRRMNARLALDEEEHGEIRPPEEDGA